MFVKLYKKKTKKKNLNWARLQHWQCFAKSCISSNFQVISEYHCHICRNRIWGMEGKWPAHSSRRNWFKKQDIPDSHVHWCRKELLIVSLPVSLKTFNLISKASLSSYLKFATQFVVGQPKTKDLSGSVLPSQTSSVQNAVHISQRRAWHLSLKWECDLLAEIQRYVTHMKTQQGNFLQPLALELMEKHFCFN